MNRKQLTLLIALGVVLGGLAIYFARQEKETYTASAARMGDKVVASFPINDISQITIKQPQSEVNLAKKNDVWVVRERSDYAANFSEIAELVRKIADLKITQPIKLSSPASLAKLELITPDKGTNAGTLIEFKDKDGKILKTLLLGKKHHKESPSSSPYGGGSWPDGRYVMVGNDLQSVALISDAMSNVENKPEAWLDKEFFKVEKIRAISVVSTNATNSWKVSRETESGEWKLADAKPEEKLDTGKTSSLGSALSSATFADVAKADAKPDETGLDKPITATIETFDNLTYQVKIGKKASDENYYFQVALSGEPPKERVPGKDEKPEDKTKLDKEFKEKATKLADKIKQEKAYEKYAYLVSKWTIDPLLKERKDLLEEKKEEPKKDEKPAPETKPDAK